VNVRFENGKITRGPVFRTVKAYTSEFEPAFLFSIPPIAAGFDGLVSVNSSFTKVYQVAGDTLTDLTPTSVTSITSSAAYTAAFLGNVAYLNRPSHVPHHKAPGDVRFLPLTAWNSNWRTSSLRAYKDFLVALNVTKSGISYPTMVKWSDTAGFGGPPSSWDEASTTNSAGENILNEMREPIVDGLSLRDSFIIYGSNEVWLMDYIGGAFLFRFRKLYDSVGVINQNCVVQVDGTHYVFDRNDIYVHDGATKKSILHGRNKDYLFQSLNYAHADLSFVSHDPRLNEIHFCYVSGDANIAFRNASTGCNRAAVYNYRRDTWSFYDLPNVTGAANGAVSTGKTWTTIGNTVTYDTVGGSYLSNEDDKDQHTLFVGRIDESMGLTASRIYGLDVITGSRLLRPVEPQAIAPAFIERVGIDLDDVGADLTLYKALHAIYPQLGNSTPGSIEFQFGASDVVGLEPVWSERIAYDPSTDTKVDIRESGRYLAYRLYHTGTSDFALSGFDVKISIRGRR
jgi:hypothetical protein